MGESLRPAHGDMVSMLRAAVARAGERDALRYRDDAWTWAQVDARSDAIAAALRVHGVGRGDRVALQTQNVPAYPLACLALWKLGSVGVGVNPMYTEREIALVLEDSGALMLLGEEEIDALDGGPLVDAPAPRPDELAMLAYTSGTTGRPKGALVSHAKLAYAGEAYTCYFEVASDDEVLLAVAPFFHATGLTAGISAWLSTAATMVVPYRFEPNRVLELIERHRCTFTVGATTAFVALLNADAAPTADVSSMRRWLCGGAPIPPAVVDAFTERFGLPLVPGYGMTETTCISHGVPVGLRPPVDPVSGALSIGRPIFQTEMRIVGDDGADLTDGEAGELLVRGPSMVAGYWNKPQETAELRDADGWLRTGDIVFRDADGWTYLVDRKKDVIVASGYKVWPREVEDVLYAHPAVREAAVVGVPDPYRGETVAAFVALRPGHAVDADALLAHCRARLAAYKRPRTIELRAELPKTTSGKILRRELRDG
jgi:long-chain acyl-CoA synthetase